MKIAALILTMFAPFAHAQLATTDDVGRFCEMLPASSDQDVCMSNLPKLESDLRVLSFCGKLSSSVERVKCAQAYSGRSYSDVVLNFCLTRSNDAEKVRCLDQSPSTSIPRRAGFCESRRVRLRLHEVLGLLQAGQTYRAESTLREVLNEIE